MYNKPPFENTLLSSIIINRPSYIEHIGTFAKQAHTFSTVSRNNPGITAAIELINKRKNILGIANTLNQNSPIPIINNYFKDSNRYHTIIKNMNHISSNSFVKPFYINDYLRNNFTLVSDLSKSLYTTRSLSYFQSILNSTAQISHSLDFTRSNLNEFRNSISLVDRNLQESISSLSIHESKKLFEETRHALEDNHISNQLIDEHESEPVNVISTNFLKAHCYKIITGLFIIVAANTLQGSDLQQIEDAIEQIFSYLDHIIMVKDFLRPQSDQKTHGNQTNAIGTEMEKLVELRKNGELTKEEFEISKQRVLQ